MSALSQTTSAPPLLLENILAACCLVLTCTAQLSVLQQISVPQSRLCNCQGIWGCEETGSNPKLQMSCEGQERGGRWRSHA